MSLFSTLLAIAALISLIACVLFVLFGQITVRKLRKNPATRHALGVEFVSGWDILNVASALSTPRWLREKLSASPLSILSAKYEALYENTTRFDRFLARFFWSFLMIGGGSINLLVIAEALGAFPE